MDTSAHLTGPRAIVALAVVVLGVTALAVGPERALATDHVPDVRITDACAGEVAFAFEVEALDDVPADQLFWRGAHRTPMEDQPLAGPGEPVEAGETYAMSASRAGESAVVFDDGDGDAEVVATFFVDSLTPLCDEGPEVERIAGQNRFETAADLARRFYQEPRIVYLASGEDFADALTASGVPERSAGPVLLTGRDELPGVTREALEQLNPRHLRVLGGSAAISDDVETEAAEAAGLD